MITPAHFAVDFWLATTLGKNYSSSERALRELIDNAWDAEAKIVRITLPSATTEEPIVIADDGNEMLEGKRRRGEKKKLRKKVD
ncbi:MAG: ATP-binding protein [Terrimicrobiaceae bacterium]|nr:ATP-binding protein [Terrimicrobiaceae bacterium]